MMVQEPPTTKKEDDRICEECGRPINKHSPEQKLECSKRIMERRFGKDTGGVA